MQNKAELRKWAKEVRKSCNSCGNILAQKLSERIEYKKAKHIMLFYPTKDEINLLTLIENKDKSFYLPRVEEKELLVCPYKKGDKLVLSKLKIFEPITEAVDKKILDMAIIPALCCDKNNCRLGYGGGFYDRFLSDFNGLKVVCIPQKLIVNTVFPEKYDIPADIIIT